MIKVLPIDGNRVISGKIGDDVYMDCSHITKDVRDDIASPAEYMYLNMLALSKSRVKLSNNGQFFEILITDMLLKYTNVQLSQMNFHVPIWVSKDMDVDIRITVNAYQFIDIHCKTSLRERWAKDDRTMLYVNGVKGIENIWGIEIFHTEHWKRFIDDPNYEYRPAAIKDAIRKTKKCQTENFAILSIYSLEFDAFISAISEVLTLGFLQGGMRQKVGLPEWVIS